MTMLRRRKVLLTSLSATLTAISLAGTLSSSGDPQPDIALPAIGPTSSPTVVRQRSLSPGESLDIRPGVGHEWEVGSIWASGQCALERVVSGTAVAVDSLASGSRWWRLDRERVMYDAYLRVRNTGSGTVLAGFSAVSLSEDWPSS